jgi:hypothetical protein
MVLAIAEHPAENKTIDKQTINPDTKPHLLIPEIIFVLPILFEKSHLASFNPCIILITPEIASVPIILREISRPDCVAPDFACQCGG